MKKFFIIILMAVGLMACTDNKFEAMNIIHPEILSTDRLDKDIAIQYTIGDIMVLDELDNLNQAEYSYIEKHQDDVEIGLKIIFSTGGDL